MRKHDIIVDGQSLSELVTILDVKREMGKPVKNRIISVDVIVKQDVMKTIDVLNRLLTGDLQQFIFTDQPDRYWEGKVLSGITPSSSERWSRITFEIEVPDGVAYALEPVEMDLGQTGVIAVENKGTDVTYPVIDFKINNRTYMVSVINEDDVFQYGETYDDAPLKDFYYTTTETKAGYYVDMPSVLVNKRWCDLTTSSYDISNLWMYENHFTTGSFSRRGGVTADVSSGRITIAQHATHWQTGERMANWVKGQTFDIAQTKNVRQSNSTKAYLLRQNGVYIGWLLEQDIAGTKKASNSNDMVPNYGSSSNVPIKQMTNPAYGRSAGWHGPAMRYSIPGTCSDFETSTWHNFYKHKSSEQGKFIYAVMSGSEVLAMITIATYGNNMNASINFYADGRSLDMGSYSRQLAARFWGYSKITKKGGQYTFEVYNDIKKQSVKRTFNLRNSTKKPTHVMVWLGKNTQHNAIGENSVHRTRFEGLNTRTWVAPKDVQKVHTYQLKVPDNVFETGDIIRLDMRDNSATLNGQPMLSPIAFGSSNVGIKPGKQELILTSDTTGALPSVFISYREVFR